MTLLRHSSSVERSWKPYEKASELSVQPQPFQPVARESCHHPCSTHRGWGGSREVPFQRPVESWSRAINGVHNTREGEEDAGVVSRCSGHHGCPEQLSPALHSQAAYR